MGAQLSNLKADSRILTASIGCGLGVLLLLLNKKKLTQKSVKWVKVGKVDRLTVYPIKSAKGVDTLSADFKRLGIKAGVYRDRTFCIVKDDRFVIQIHVKLLFSICFTQIFVF